MALPLRALRVTTSAVAALLLAACSAAPKSSQAPVPVAAAAPIPEPRPVDARIAIPSMPVGLGAPPMGSVHFEHTPGLTWDLDVLPFEGHERVQRYVALFSGGARDRFTEWLHRGTRYDAMIRAKLRAGGLPEDLTYLALVESGYDVHATSRVHAIGMWQFMAETARDAGLRVDWWVDERRDPVRATDGAVRTLRWLKGQFGSLFVAAAAYNGGPGRVSRGLAQLASVDSVGALPAGDARFFALVERDVLRDETKNYVPQLIAAALVAKEAARYDIRPRPIAPLAYDSVRVPGLTPLAAVAAASHATRADLLDLNPHFLRGMTPPGAGALVRVPAGQGAATLAAFETLGDEVRRPFRVAVTRKHESWSELAERLGVSRACLTTYNGALTTVAHGKHRGQFVGGQPVRVPTDAVLAYARDVLSDGDGPGALPAFAPPAESRVAAAAARERDTDRTSESPVAARDEGATRATSSAKRVASAGAVAANRGEDASTRSPRTKDAHAEDASAEPDDVEAPTRAERRAVRVTLAADHGPRTTEAHPASKARVEKLTSSESVPEKPVRAVSAAAKSTTAESSTAKFSVATSVTAEPVAAPSVATKSVAAKSGATKSGAATTGAVKALAAKPAAANAVAAKPGVAKSVTDRAASEKPSATKLFVDKARANKPSAAMPATAKSDGRSSDAASAERPARKQSAASHRTRKAPPDDEI